MGCLASKTRRQARSVGLSFALASFVLLAGDLAVMFVSAMLCQGRRRPYIWLSRGFGCLLRVANLGFIIAWMVAAAQDNMQRMVICSTAIATRVLGMCLYAVVYFVEGKIKPESTADLIQSLVLHSEELASRVAIPVILVTSAIDAFFLFFMVRYQMIFAKKEATATPPAASPSGASPLVSPPTATAPSTAAPLTDVPSELSAEADRSPMAEGPAADVTLSSDASASGDAGHK